MCEQRQDLLPCGIPGRHKPPSNKRKVDSLVSNVLDFLSKYSDVNNKCLRVPTKINGAQFVKQESNANLKCEGSEAVLEKSPHIAHKETLAFPSGSFNNAELGTPDCVITKVLERSSSMSAPKMNPTNKVKARRFNLISEEDEQTLINGNHSSPKFDVLNDFCTVPHVSKLESSLNKPQTGNFKLNRVIFLQKPGSKMTSIKIPDVSPNPPPKGSYDGLQAVGSNDFRRRGSELSKKADNTYNKMTLCKQQGRIAETVETVKLRRKFRFVKLLITGQHPPLQINNRHPVSEEDIIHYSAMVELAHNSHKKTLGVLYPKVHCSYQSLGESLMPNGEIDNFLIPCFCRMLFEERHPSSSGRHYFFPHIGESILIYVGEHQESTVRTSFQGAAKASKGRNLGHKDNRLFFPIVNSGHWFTFVVDFEYESFVFLDSFYDKESNFHRSINNQLINNFTHLWELIISIDHNFGRFKVLYPNVPKQQNLKDCGIFAMFLMEKWKPNVDLCNILSYQDILNIRIIYANRLFFSPQNQTDMSLVTDFYAAG